MSILLSDVIKELSVDPQVCPTDERLYRYINAGVRDIFLEGNYAGIFATYNFMVYDSTITLPFDLEALLQADLLSRPISVQNQWHEFLQNGTGYQDGKRNFCYPDMYDRGDGWCTIQDPCQPFTVQAYCAVPENPLDVITIEGLDQYGNKIRSQITTPNGDGTVSSQWINGVQLPLFNPGSPYTETAQVFSRITAVSLPKRNGDLRLIASIRAPQTLTPLGITHLLGVYSYQLTNPNFHRYHFPPAKQEGELFRPVPVKTIVRKRFIPVSNPQDRLPINNVRALRYYTAAAWKEEEEQYSTADYLRQRGKYCLEQEMRKTRASMTTMNVQFRGFGSFGRSPGAL